MISGKSGKSMIEERTIISQIGQNDAREIGAGANEQTYTPTYIYTVCMYIQTYIKCKNIKIQEKI